MKILLILDVDPDDAEPANTCGLTEEAHRRLVRAILGAGFGVEKGPDAEPAEVTT